MKLLRYTGKNTLLKLVNVKVGLCLLLIAYTLWSYDRPYLEFVKEKNVPISWCIFPFMLAGFRFLSLFYLCIVYINSDVPFLQHANMYQVIRVGRWRWAAGQVGGIFLRSLFLTVFSAVAAFLPFMGHLDFSNEWGRVIHTLAMQGTASLSGFFDTYWDKINYSFEYYEILGEYTPLQLMALCILLLTLICLFLGLLMFMLSVLFGRPAAVVGGCAYVILLFFAENAYGWLRQKVSYFVPTHWAEFAASATPTSNGYPRMPSLTYMLAFLIISNLLMILVICVRVRHMEFNWENEDA